MTSKPHGSDDPRYVAIVSVAIAASPDQGRRVWIRGESPLLPDTKVQVIFTPKQVRFYPLTARAPANTPHAAPLRFRVAPFQHVGSSDHIIHSDQGVAVYTPIVSREERVRWAMERARPDSLLDQMEIVNELQHLITHRLVTKTLAYTDERRADMQGFLDRIEQVFWMENAKLKLDLAKNAIFLGRKLAFTQEGA